MFNRTYQLRALKTAGGGHQVAQEASLCLPWAGIFRPVEPWRSLVMIAAAAEKIDSAPTFYRPKRALRPRNAAGGCKKRSGKLQGVQLDLFPDIFTDNAAQNFTGASNFYRPKKIFTRDPERPLADLIPEAYE